MTNDLFPLSTESSVLDVHMEEIKVKREFEQLSWRTISKRMNKKHDLDMSVHYYKRHYEKAKYMAKATSRLLLASVWTKQGLKELRV